MVSAGGECPAINHVGYAIYQRAREHGMRVVGIRFGMDGLVGNSPNFVELDEAFFRVTEQWSGSLFGMSRTGFTKTPELLDPTLRALTSPPISANYVATIGGDDTLTSACRWLARARELGIPLRVAHAPKSIDNDPPLPDGVSTFGFDTATDEAARQLFRLAGDFGSATNRLCLVSLMGRGAGFYAYQSIKKASAHWSDVVSAMGLRPQLPYVFLPEMFPQPVTLDFFVDRVVIAARRTFQAAKDTRLFVPKLVLMAEGVFERLDKPSQERFASFLRLDEAEHIELALVPFVPILANMIGPRLKNLGISCKPRYEEIGFTTRTVLPLTAVDLSYAAALGKGLVDYLVADGSGGMVWVEDGQVKVLEAERIPRDAKGKVVPRSLRLMQPDCKEFLAPSFDVLAASPTEARPDARSVE